MSESNVSVWDDLEREFKFDPHYEYVERAIARGRALEARVEELEDVVRLNPQASDVYAACSERIAALEKSLHQAQAEWHEEKKRAQEAEERSRALEAQNTQLKESQGRLFLTIRAQETTIATMAEERESLRRIRDAAAAMKDWASFEGSETDRLQHALAAHAVRFGEGK